MLPSEPVTIVLSQMGWVRSAKGHDIDAPGLNYKAGDSFKAAVKGKSNQPVVFVDSTGRSYAIDPDYAAVGAWSGRAAHRQINVAARSDR